MSEAPRGGARRKLTGREETLPVAGAPVAQDALDIELGIEAGLTDTATVGAACTGQYGGGAGHGITAELRVRLQSLYRYIYASAI